MRERYTHCRHCVLGVPPLAAVTPIAVVSGPGMLKVSKSRRSWQMLDPVHGQIWNAAERGKKTEFQGGFIGAFCASSVCGPSVARQSVKIIAILQVTF